MFDKILFSKICDAECSFDELSGFVKNIDKKEFDVDNPFDKYYCLERIISIIEKYQANIITEKYLACWMNAYNWIIMGGFNVDNGDEPISLKEFLIWQICDWLDSLSFFDCGAEYNLEEYKESFETLDRLYRDCDRCDAMFAPYGYNDDDVVCLITNARSSYYAMIFSELDFINDKIDMKQTNADDIKNRIKTLHQLGYIKLPYGSCDDEDFK